MVDYLTVYPKVKTLQEAKATICIRKGDFRPDEDLCMLPVADKKLILDFGCGVGRNLAEFLHLTNAKLVGYDFPNMTALAKKYLMPEQYDYITWLNPPLENLMGLHFDLITAILVFQHIREQELRKILPCLASCLKEDGLMYVHTNSTMNEGNKFVWKIILDYFKFVKYLERSPVPRKWKDTPLVQDVNNYYMHTHQKVLLKVK